MDVVAKEFVGLTKSYLVAAGGVVRDSADVKIGGKFVTKRNVAYGVRLRSGSVAPIDG